MRKSKCGNVVTAPERAEDASICIVSANIRRKEKLFTTAKADVGIHRRKRRAACYLQTIAALLQCRIVVIDWMKSRGLFGDLFFLLSKMMSKFPRGRGAMSNLT